MNRLLDKLVILILCLYIYVQDNLNTYYLVIPVIIFIILSCINEFLNNKIYKLFNFLIYLMLCIYYPNFVYFLPVICYDIFFEKKISLISLSIIPLILHFKFNETILLLIFTAIAAFLKYRYISFKNIKNSYIDFKDKSTENSIKLEMQNKELIEKQNNEINIAILTERNRIAREIHDNVGHLLSSSILQIGALTTTIKNDKINNNLNILKDTLNKGMDNIRSDVHMLHDEYIDLKLEIDNLVNKFNFCKINFYYNIKQNPNKNIKFCFISIIKEGLTNIVKHSNATIVNLSLMEYPSFYQLILSDNGKKNKNITAIDYSGIGIKNMKKRIENLNGLININNKEGFNIFISIPK